MTECIPCNKKEIDWSEFPSESPPPQDLLNQNSHVKIQGAQSRLKVQLQPAEVNVQLID
jgi:hypothetical protein